MARREPIVGLSAHRRTVPGAVRELRVSNGRTSMMRVTSGQRSNLPLSDPIARQRVIKRVIVEEEKANSQCTRTAHVATQIYEILDFFLQSIIGATQRRWALGTAGSLLAGADAIQDFSATSDPSTSGRLSYVIMRTCSTSMDSMAFAVRSAERRWIMVSLVNAEAPTT